MGITFIILAICVLQGSADLFVSDHDLNVAVKYAEDYVSRLHRLEKSLAVSDIDVEKISPSHGQLIDSSPTGEALNFARSAMVVNRASLFLSQRHCRRHGIQTSECVQTIGNWTLRATPMQEKCNVQFPRVRCKSSEMKYRSIDGRCNHEMYPTRGRSFTPYRRLIPPMYADGILEPRKSLGRRPLMSARLISNLLVPDLDRPEQRTTLALAQWTQFIANDLFHTVVHKMVHTENSIECCRPDGKPLTPRYIHPSCQQITIPTDDPVYGPHRITCMNYVRSLSSLRTECTFGPAQQMNQATHYLDGSMIYGVTDSEALSLRAMDGGRLATSDDLAEDLLPLSAEPDLQCQVQGSDSACYKSGDSRVNLTPLTIVMYTIWVREHNRIAAVLQAINPHWDDDKLYHEARRIVIAQIQHITYSRWALEILGEAYWRKMKLDVKPKGFGGSFSEDVDPSVSNSFATAAFNFVHSMEQSTLELHNEERTIQELLNLKEHFNNPNVTRRAGVMDSLLRGFSTQRSQRVDASYVEDVTSQLYKGNSSFGLDIFSLAIQRGRDHGLPGYNAYRKFCKISANNKFETFQDTIPKAQVTKLKGIFAHPDDVDVVVGAILETPVNGAKVGPTLSCLISEQLSRTRKGDRFFYELGQLPHSFSELQISELKKTTLARVICDNSEGIVSMQADVFLRPSESNPLLLCSDSRIPKVDLRLWKNSK